MHMRRIVLVLTLLATGLLAEVGAAHEVRLPRTLADRTPVGAGPVDPAFPIDYVGVTFDLPGDRHVDEGGDHGAIRFLRRGSWGPWRPLIEDGAQEAGAWASGLIPAGDADAYQVRGLPPAARRARAVAINTTDGPLRTVATERSGAASAIPSCVARSEWGADESLRFDGNGDEIWPPEFYGAQVMTVHHTATRNDDPDPAATVRAIYRFHAVDRGWGDIGYHYLIDEQGRTYEGRWSGSASTPCAGGGDGGDFGHETTADDARVVTAAHTGGYNSGNLGVALLGRFTTEPIEGGDPTATAVDALEGVLAELSSRHGIDPEAVVTYRNPHPSSDATRTVHTISGHRDWVATQCPGDNLYEDLPEIRSRVAARMDPGGSSEPAPESMHVGDLDGWSTDTRGRDWAAVVRVRIVDDHGDPVGDAVVEGTWSRGGDDTCTTGDTGRCRVRSKSLHKRVKRIRFSVTDVDGSLAYDATANTDPDGDSDGTTISVRRD